MEEIKKEGFFTRLGKGLAYRLRKTIIAIYHNPYSVVLLLSAVSMMYFTFNFQKIARELTEGVFSTISNGFLIFLWTICAYLSVVSYLFYSGKKKNWIMYGVFIVMMGAQLYASIYYTTNAIETLNAELNNPAISYKLEEILSAEKVIRICQTSSFLIVFVVVCAVVVIFLDMLFKKQRKAKYEAKKAAKLQGK